MKKMSLANIEGKLSRTEMRSIMAGSSYCSSKRCSVYSGGSGMTYYGSCTGSFGNNTAECWCDTAYGYYQPTSNGGMSRCWN